MQVNGPMLPPVVGFFISSEAALGSPIWLHRSLKVTAVVWYGTDHQFCPLGAPPSAGYRVCVMAGLCDPTMMALAGRAPLIRIALACGLDGIGIVFAVDRTQVEVTFAPVSALTIRRLVASGRPRAGHMGPGQLWPAAAPVQPVVYGLKYGIEVQLSPMPPAPAATNGWFSLNPMFEATEAPPAARIRVAAATTATAERIDLILI